MLQTIGFPAGARQVDAKATFFRYENGTAGGGDESIRLRADGQDLGVFWPGDSVDLPVEASRWTIEPTLPTCTGVVRLGLGRVQSARLSGSVRVIDEITDAITLATASLSTATQLIGWIPIIDPAVNVRGLVLRGFGVSGGAGAGGSINLQMCAAKSMPVGFDAPSQKYVMAGASSNTTTMIVVSDVRMNKMLPRGFGVFFGWEIRSTVASVPPGYQLNYELL